MKDLLLHINNTETLPSRMQAAFNVAKLFDATIHGIYVKRQLKYEVYGTFLNPDTVDEFLQTENDGAAKAKRLFNKLAQANAQNNEIPFTYAEVSGDASRKLCRYACVNDLVVLEKEQHGSHDEILHNLAANVVLESGRPVMLVPSEPKTNGIGKSIFVAWNGSAESARAVHDAMPLLQAAESVNVVTFHAPHENSNTVPDITDHLKNYNVVFDVSDSDSKDSRIMENLIRLTERFESDLVVMGAYGHSRFREYVLGGVSRSAINELNIPLFISH